MVYKTFLELVKSSLQTRLGDEFTVMIHPVPKNNGLSVDGLCIMKTTSEPAPAIYLNNYYMAYLDGLSLEAVLDEIVGLYQNSRLPSDLDLNRLAEENQLLDKVVYRFINEPANKDLLPHIPHISYPELELALVFYLLLKEDSDGQLTALIHNEHLKNWSLSTDDLFLAAGQNTPKLLPPFIRTMKEAMKDIAQNSLGDSYDETLVNNLLDMDPPPVPLYVFSNTSGLHGACCMIYDGILKDFANLLGSDLVILPSSVHEVLLTPYDDGISYEDLNETVVEINHDEVPPQDQLSNHIYYYDREKDCLSTAYYSFVPIGTVSPSIVAKR